jgi:quercetin dioxygenase-like cupin family protein
MKNPNKETEQNLEVDLLNLLSLSVPPVTPSDDAKIRMKEKLFNKVEDALNEGKFFVFADKGNWIKAASGVEIKMLHETPSAKSYLVKLSANAVIPRHSHAHNEVSFVLEGEVVLDGTLCKQGDYHFAAAGTIHRSISSDSGCTLLIKTS